MNTTVFLAELKTRAVEMLAYLISPEANSPEQGLDGAGKIEVAVEQALDQAANELSMQKFAEFIAALGGAAKVEDILTKDLQEMTEEHLAHLLGLSDDPLRHPANLAREEIEGQRPEGENPSCWTEGYRDTIKSHYLEAKFENK